jgi:hypothetical protein
MNVTFVCGSVKVSKNLFSSQHAGSGCCMPKNKNTAFWTLFLFSEEFIQIYLIDPRVILQIL